MEEEAPMESFKLEEREDPLDDPFAYLAALVRGELSYDKNSLSSLENNMTVMQILDAAVRSSKEGTTILIED